MYAYSCLGVLSMSFFFVMQKTAYERRISDWSSYVCSSDLAASLPVRTIGEPEGVELAYETVDWRPAESGRITDAIYEEYGLQAIRIHGAQAHPTKLVQSVAMASVAPPKPSYRPGLPANIVTDGLPSDAPLEKNGTGNV